MTVKRSYGLRCPARAPRPGRQRSFADFGRRLRWHPVERRHFSVIDNHPHLSSAMAKACLKALDHTKADVAKRGLLLTVGGSLLVRASTAPTSPTGWYLTDVLLRIQVLQKH